MKFALRSLARTPGFTLVAVATLALCIGANSAIFSVVNAILLKPYPWPGSERLVYVGNVFPKLGQDAGNGISIPDYLDHRAGVLALAESALIAGANANLSFDGMPERVYGLSVTPSLFSLLQTQPALGRAFTSAEAEPGAGKTIVLLHAFWQGRFAGNPGVIGKTVRLNDEPHEIVGVMPEGFYFPSLRAQFFVPYIFTPEQKGDTQRYTQFSTMLARLKPDATIASANRELEAVHRAVRERLPSARDEFAVTGYTSAAKGYLETNVKDVRTMLWILQAGVVVALLIGCANVANLLLARASARQREFAIRAALGAGRGRLIRQLLTESVLLFLAGGALGLLLAWWSLGAVNGLGVGNLPRGFGVALDVRVFGFTFACALATGLAFGALPAVSATRGDAGDALKSAGTRTTSGRRQLSLRGALAVIQVALSLMLLTTAGLLLRSFQQVQDESPGFATANTLTAALSLPVARYPTPETRAAFAARLAERLAAIPGVQSAGITNSLPFTGGNPQGGYQIEGFDPGSGQPNPHGMIRQVDGGYFQAMGIPLLRGRLIEPTDTLGRENVIVIDRYLADRYWPGRDPIGQRISRGDNASLGRGSWTIVGVVGTIKHWDLEAEVRKETLYFPYAQTPNANFSFVVKTTVDPGSLQAAVRAAVLAIDPDQPISDLKTLDARLDESLQRRRAPMLLLTVFAGVAVALASLGIYGVLAFSVTQRTSEFGIRMALGADRANILRLVIRQGVRIVGAGLTLGLAGYFALSSFIGTLLYRIAPTDPVTLLAAPVLLALVALAACLLPARRATKVDPQVALRAE